MEPSPEVANVLARLLDAIRDGDEQAVSNRFSRQPGFERYGSDPAEHWRDGDEAVLVLIQQIRETGGFPWRRVGDIHAMSEGTVGWASGEMEFETALGDAVPYRVSCVLHLEHGEWKIVQWLSAVPATNESYGFLLTTSVDDIAVSVQAARPDLSGTMSADGTVTIAFTDIEDSTKLNGLLGDDRWMAVLHVHNGVIESVTAEFDGTVVKNQGDGFMLAFPSSRRALACGLAIQQAIWGAVQRSWLADPGADRAPRGRDDPRGRRLLRARGRVRSPDRVLGLGRGDRRVVARSRLGRADGWVQLRRAPHGRVKGHRGFPDRVPGPRPPSRLTAEEASAKAFLRSWHWVQARACDTPKTNFSSPCLMGWRQACSDPRSIQSRSPASSPRLVAELSRRPLRRSRECFGTCCPPASWSPGLGLPRLVESSCMARTR